MVHGTWCIEHGAWSKLVIPQSGRSSPVKRESKEPPVDPAERERHSLEAEGPGAGKKQEPAN